MHLAFSLKLCENPRMRARAEERHAKCSTPPSRTDKVAGKHPSDLSVFNENLPRPPRFSPTHPCDTCSLDYTVALRIPRRTDAHATLNIIIVGQAVIIERRRPAGVGYFSTVTDTHHCRPADLFAETCLRDEKMIQTCVGDISSCPQRRFHSKAHCGRHAERSAEWR